MRAIKLSIASLICLLCLLLFGHRVFQSFAVSGQAALSAPTNVSASDNAYATKVGISWDTIRGGTLYRILRHTSNDSSAAVTLGTTVEGSFFDTTGTAGQTYFYWVRAERASVVSGLSAPDEGTRASGVINGPVAPLNPPPPPPANPVTATKAYLGKTLFWDEQLSSTRTVACGTCHFAANGGSDSRTTVNTERSRNPGADGVFFNADDVFASPGVISNNADGTFSLSPVYGLREQVTGRKARSYIDAGYSNSLFWDGRATQVFTDPIGGAVVLSAGAALESQALGPPVSSAEMAHSGRTWNDVAVRISSTSPLALSPSIPDGLREWIGGRSYPDLFEEAFGTPEVTPARIAMAIATFERTLYSDRTPFDQSVAQITQLTAAETRGRGVFNQSGCNVCHAGSLFTDNQFHNIGLRPQTEDTGRFQVTGNTNDMGEFRTPSLRNVALRGPYMHNGRFATLEEVVEFYNRGGDFDAPNINHNLIRPLNLSAPQKSDLLAFLRRPLTDPRVMAGTAPFDRPTLYTESPRVPIVVGAGTAGTGGNTPQVIAVEPPLVGNPSFAVGVSNALGGAQAVLVIDGSDPGTGPNIPATASFARLNVKLSGSGAGQGFGSVSLLIPNISTLAGSSFIGRWFITDPGAAGGVAVTPAFKFTVFGEATSGVNAIDDSSFFITQQYQDFLMRFPEPEGLKFYVDILNGCQPTDIECIKYSRGALSANFFRSPEFQAKGSLVMYLYMISFGQRPVSVAELSDSSKVERPHYAEFMADVASITDPADRNGPDPTKKAAFLAAWVQRPEFLALYPASLTNVQLGAALANKAGVTLSSTTQNAIAAAPSRAEVARIVAESPEVDAKFYKAAFVTMEYFGYLRRDPEDCHNSANWFGTPDGSGCGYIFHNNRFHLAADPDFLENTIVRGFIESPEYRRRFGP